MSAKQNITNILLSVRSDDLSAYLAELHAVRDSVDDLIYKVSKERVANSDKWLHKDLRDKLSDELNSASVEANGNDAYTEDYDLYTDQELVDEYSDLVDGDEEDGLLSEALLAKAEFDMLTK